MSEILVTIAVEVRPAEVPVVDWPMPTLAARPLDPLTAARLEHLRRIDQVYARQRSVEPYLRVLRQRHEALNRIPPHLR